jgi:3-hydroxyacyl-CoA dehydrogenase/enoyl-CoA hydratase/3-hydroxybutyryl-CoA epimerase
MKNDHLELEYTGDDLAILWLDQKDRPVNTISSEALDAYDEAFDAIADSNARAVVIASRKEDSFVAGADVKALQTMEKPHETEQLSRKGHGVLRRVRRTDLPIVAAIHGPALGGGLELALAADYRIATDEDPTRMALPEVNLGLVPGGGGTQFLPRLVGLQQALPMLLTGKSAYPSKAERIGLVDVLTHRDGLLHAAKEAARELADGEIELDRGPKRVSERLLESNTVSRRLIYNRAESRVVNDTKGNYPAPFRILGCVRTGLEKGLEAGFEAEAEAFGELSATEESKQLVFLFFAKQEAEKNPFDDAEARDVRRMGVLGGGLMGAGIAQISAEDDMDVLLKDQDIERAADARETVWQNLTRDVEKGIHSHFERDVIAERVVPVADYAPFGSADLVIEAVPEDLDIKHGVLKELTEELPDDAIIASNTSALPITQIAEPLPRPERVLGMHYFSPVPSIPLMEVIRTDATSDEALATACEVGLRQGKTLIVVNDGPGFYTTRILALFMNEAMLLLEEGAKIDQVDEALEQFGFPMGPYELLDLVGLDTASKITDVLSKLFEERNVTTSAAADKLVEHDLLGQKTERGFYEYEPQEGKRPEKQDVNKSAYRFFGGSDRTRINAELIQQRLALTMVNEAVRCLEDGVLRSARDGDVGAVFGLGFPPFRGGPFRHVDTQDAATVVMRLERLKKAYGDRFEPAPTLREHADEDTAFYDESAPQAEQAAL